MNLTLTIIKINVKFFSAVGHTAQAPFQTTLPVGMGLRKDQLVGPAGGLRDFNRPLIVRAPPITPIKQPPQLSQITLNPQPTSINQPGKGQAFDPQGKARGGEGRGPFGKGKGGEGIGEKGKGRTFGAQGKAC